MLSHVYTISSLPPSSFSFLSFFLSTSSFLVLLSSSSCNFFSHVLFTFPLYSAPLFVSFYPIITIFINKFENISSFGSHLHVTVVSHSRLLVQNVTNIYTTDFISHYVKLSYSNFRIDVFHCRLIKMANRLLCASSTFTNDPFKADVLSLI